jgi:hypothetical protein
MPNRRCWLAFAANAERLSFVRFCGRDLGLIAPRGVFRRFAPPRAGLRETPEDAATTKMSTINPVQTVDHQPG